MVLRYSIQRAIVVGVVKEHGLSLRVILRFLHEIIADCVVIEGRIHGWLLLLVYQTLSQLLTTPSAIVVIILLPRGRSPAH